MFVELMPLLAGRTVVITVAREDEKTVRVCVIPKAKDDENRALSTPLSYTGTPEELDAELGRAHPFELRLGYVHDSLSFAAPGDMGELNASYLGEEGRVGLEYEEWSRFNERVRRAGFNFSRRYGGKWWLRGGAMWGPGATVVARGEYTGGISRTLPHRFVLDGDYRYLGFKTAEAHIAAPSLSYYFAKPRWIQVTSYSAWARLGTNQHFTNSWLFRYYQQVARPLRLHARRPERRRSPGPSRRREGRSENQGRCLRRRLLDRFRRLLRRGLFIYFGARIDS